MDISQLRYFKTVAETQNMSKAAKLQFISQPAMSKSIKTLEEELGGPLFDRFGKSLVLNEGGRILLRYTNQILGACTELKNELNDYYKNKFSTISLSINVGLGILSSILPDFLDANPGIQIHLDQVDNSMPDRDDYDICINCSTDPIESPCTKTILTENFVLALSHKHPLANAPEIYIRDIAKEKFIQVKGDALIRLTKECCKTAGFEPHISFYTDFPTTTLNLISMDLGVAFVPEITWGDMTQKNIVLRKVKDLTYRRYISISWRDTSYLSASAALLRDHLIQYFATNFPIAVPVESSTVTEE